MTFNLEQWVFTHYGQEVFTPGLIRIARALAPLKKQLEQSKIVIIAGTNGKGETTHRLGEYLSKSTFCSWTSPHIQSIHERFSSQNGDISEDELEKFFLRCHETVQENKYQLTYYEFLFYVFCCWAVEQKPEYLLLEVGLGGRMDAVNALDAELVLLSSISRDHQEFLGHRFDGILKEKLGVLRPGKTLISFLDLNYLRERARTLTQNLGASIIDLEEVIKLPAYDFSSRNEFLAYAAFCFLKKMPLKSETWLPNPQKLSSRGEVVQEKNQWWLFGSHNVDGMRKLIQFLSDENYNFRDIPFKAVVSSFSKRNEKDVRVMLKMLKGAGLGEVLITSFDHPKAYPKDALKDLCDQEGLKFVEDLFSHVQGWTHQKILVAGSYYLLGQLKPLLRNR